MAKSKGKASLQIEFSVAEGKIIEKFKHRYEINNKKECVRRMVLELNEIIFKEEDK